MSAAPAPHRYAYRHPPPLCAACARPSRRHPKGLARRMEPVHAAGGALLGWRCPLCLTVETPADVRGSHWKPGKEKRRDG